MDFIKGALKRIKSFSENEVVCLATLVAALAYDMYYLDLMNPLKYSLSEIGRHTPALFVLWSVVSGIALLLNVRRFYARTGYTSKVGKICLYCGLFFLICTFSNMSREPVLYWIHVATAILFAVLGFASVALGLLKLFKKNLKFRVLTSIFFVFIFVDLILLMIYTQMALYEFIPLILGFVVLFFTNFTEFFRLPDAVQAETAKADTEQADAYAEQPAQTDTDAEQVYPELTYSEQAPEQATAPTDTDTE
ncbi:MAG: hypothetical protein LBT55_07160 [Clostridiaceae bacterium]|jgi:hypothetical protein|nr:hypothetical protein [Clostridiaceae bacterium]